MFEYHDEKGTRILIGVYVDDLVMAHNNHKLIAHFVDAFKRKFKAEYLGKLSYFLGIAVDQLENGSISIHQSQYIRDIAARSIWTTRSLYSYPKIYALLARIL